MPILALAVTCGHFVVVAVFPAIERRLPKSRWAPSTLHISYQDGRGVLRRFLALCTQQEFSVSRVQMERETSLDQGLSGAQAGKGRGTGWEDQPVEGDEEAPVALAAKGIVTLLIEVRGARSVARLTARLSEIRGVTSVRAADANVVSLDHDAI